MEIVTSSGITLKGSTETVSEFFGFCINSILYQRGIYPPETFQIVKQYGLPMLLTKDKELTEYIAKVLFDVKEWLTQMTVQKLVLVIKNIDNGETVERWQFNIECDKTVTVQTVRDRTEKDIQKEIQGLFRQIIATVTFLPLFDFKCSFDILVYTDIDQKVPSTWNESDPALVKNSQEVKLTSFSTSIHKIEGAVSYKILE